MTTMKICTLCGKTKPLTEYGKKTKYHDGMDPWCKSCKRERDVARYHANPEAAYQRARAYLLAHPEQAKAYKQKSAAKTRTEQRQKRRGEIATLGDSYVRQLFCEGNSLSHADIPQCLVDARRELIQLKRALKNG
jgi:hypothetical protein